MKGINKSEFVRFDWLDVDSTSWWLMRNVFIFMQCIKSEENLLIKKSKASKVSTYKIGNCVSRATVTRSNGVNQNDCTNLKEKQPFIIFAFEFKDF